MKSWPLQQAVYAQLAAAAPIAALGASVVDHVDPEATGPQVVVGDDIAQEHDTDDTSGASVLVDVHVWTRAHRGRKLMKQIQDEVYAALHRQPLDVAGMTVASVDFEQSHSDLDPDGITRHGVSRFRVLMCEEA